MLTALKRLPKKWALEAERELNHERFGPNWDPQLDKEFQALEEMPEGLADLELEELDLATELLLTPPPHAESKEDAQKCSNMALSPVPKAIAEGFQRYHEFRQAPFCRHRTGGQVVSTTVESDQQNALRWLGFVVREHHQRPALELFASPLVSQWTQAWLEKLKSLGLKASTLATYCNGVIQLCNYALTLVASPEACPLEELINLRAQAEAMAKQERLFEPRSKNWLSWEAANEARVAAIGKYNAATHPATKTNLLRDCLVLAFHTLQGKQQQKPEELP